MVVVAAAAATADFNKQSRLQAAELGLALSHRLQRSADDDCGRPGSPPSSAATGL